MARSALARLTPKRASGFMQPARQGCMAPARACHGAGLVHRGKCYPRVVGDTRFGRALPFGIRQRQIMRRGLPKGAPLRLLNGYFTLLKQVALSSELIHVMPQNKYAKRG